MRRAGGRMRIARLLLVVLALYPGWAVASEWGGIEPGASTVQEVRQRYGAPSKELRPKVEGYDTIQLVYEGDRAPSGINKMTVDCGVLTAGGYKPDMVRLLTLEPKPGIFGRLTVVQGWGIPDGLGSNPDGSTTMVWRSGLLVTLDNEGENAVLMIFSMPQPNLPIKGDQPAPVPGAPAAPR